VKLTKYCAYAGLLLGLSAVLSASAIKTSGSSYGDPDPAGSVCGGSCILPSGVTALMQNYAYSDGPGEVFSFQITSDTSDFSITLTGSDVFTAVPGDIAFGAFVCPNGGYTPCGADPTGFVTASADASTAVGLDSVTFTVDGDGKDLVFFAIETEPPTGVTNQVTAAVTLNTSTVPEPGLFPILGLAVVGLFLVRRRNRSVKLA
jgi:hypothetical protein